MKHLYKILFLLLISVSAFSQGTVKYDLSVSGITSTGDKAPFWLQNNRYGKISYQPNSFNLEGILTKDFSNTNPYFDYKLKADFLVQGDKLSTRVYFHQYYAHLRFFHFLDLIAGAREEHYGNQDPDLSCGGFLFSHNARPMPKLTAGIEHFTAVPFTGGYVEVKGGISHGWFTDNIYSRGVLLHHKYAYVRLGGKLPVRIQYGFEHVAMWGGIIPNISDSIQPSNWSAFKTIFFGGHGGSNATVSDQINALGSSRISESLRLDADIADYKVGVYWQDLMEDGPIRMIGFNMAAQDGLWGISIRNKNFPFIKAFVYEFFNSVDQSGPFHDQDGVVYGGMDNYFGRDQYVTGWTYYGRTIGTPLITSPVYNTNGAVYSLNTRVMAHHVGFEGEVQQYHFRVMTTYSKNYGLYSNLYKPKKDDTSFMIEVNKHFPHLDDMQVGVTLAGDVGSMYGNNTGLMVTIRKTGFVF